jgi:RNA polymerase sigma factor (sigma-70 family)
MAMVERQRRSAQGLFPDNAALVEACRGGDALAWNEIVDRYERLVYAIARKEGLTPDEAADVAQETFATLIASLDQIQHPDRLGSWLMTVARRLTWRARHDRSRQSVDVDSIEIGVDSADCAPVDALLVYEAIQGLSDPCRSLVVSLFFDPAEPSYAEIAVRLGRPLGSVGPLRARCLDRLKTALA